MLAQSAIPIIIVSSGTMGNNGALSGIAAVSAVHPNAYVYLPANAISAGSAAGLYYAVFSTTTAATVYNNTYSSGDPVIPATPTPFATTGPGAYTQSTTEITLVTIPVPAGAIGPNGHIAIKMQATFSGSAGIKTFKVKLGGTTLMNRGVSTTVTLALYNVEIANRGAANSQSWYSQDSVAANNITNSSGTAGEDTSGSLSLVITVTNASAADSTTFESRQASLYPKG